MCSVFRADVRCYILLYYILYYILLLLLYLILYTLLFYSSSQYSFLSSPLPIYLPSLTISPLLPPFPISSSSPHSKYTCRVLHNLIYILLICLFLIPIFRSIISSLLPNPLLFLTQYLWIIHSNIQCSVYIK